MCLSARPDCRRDRDRAIGQAGRPRSDRYAGQGGQTTYGVATSSADALCTGYKLGAIGISG